LAHCKTQNLVRSSLPGWSGLIGFFMALACLRQSFLPSYVKALIMLAIVFLCMFCTEAIFCIRGKFGLIAASSQRSLKLSRVFLKVVGWVIAIFCVSSAYWIFPEYEASLYIPYYQALSVAWPYLVAFFLFNIIWEDSRIDKPEDDYYWLAYALLTFKFDLLRNVNLKQLFLGWLVKIYFLPLMFIYMVNYMGFTPKLNSFLGVYDTAYNLIFFIDTAFVCVGYAFANNLIDTHIRSSEPTMLGWVAALICYQPFWSVIGSCYLSYGSAWEPWLASYPILQMIWAILIIISLLLYVWATISFGSRFSNLTHRGILVCGPYAYMKHPAYVSKLVSFFLLYIPFVAPDFMAVFRSMFLWGLVAGIYYIRAKTEEAHLRSIGPEYGIYEKEIAQNWKRLRHLIQ
jgi:hypothetical protein